MRRLLREPLLHFVLVGAALFALSALVSGPGRRPRTEIVITQGDVEHLASGFAKLWNRPPAPEELLGLVRDRVKEEVYYREAMAMGLDHDDVVIRRRLRQKLEFVTDDLAGRATPTDSALTAYLAAHAERYRTSTALGFRQVYLNPDRHRGTLRRDADALLAALQRLGSPETAATMGDATMLEHQFESAPLADIERIFGSAFAAAISAMPAGEWRGPVESGYGLHLVLVTSRVPGETASLARVRDAVTRDWLNDQRLEANELAYREMLTRYQVRVEGLDSMAIVPAGLSK